jgi:hypothetical protein
MTSSGKASERRDGPRIDLRLRVRWSAQTSGGPVSGEAEASDVSPKGLRLESEHKVDQGAALALVVDVGGDDDELVAAGSVMWCRERHSQTGKIIYDVGVAFESDWLSKDRGPLGQALARIFAMNSYEPARSFERTPIAIVVDGGTLGTALTGGGATLSMVNLSIGGMQLKCTGGVVDVIRAGMAVTVAIDGEGRTLSLVGKVAWVAAASEGDSRFGVELANVAAADKEVLERIRNGQSEPTRVAVTLKS